MFDFDQDQFEAIKLMLPVERKIADAGKQIPTVEARKLHEYLGVATRFNDWIQDRIESYGFQENQDFISFTEISVKPLGGRPPISYHLTLDMAKELAMVERTEQGRIARKYFLAYEKTLLGIATGEISSLDFVRQLMVEDRISRLALPDGTILTFKKPSAPRKDRESTAENLQGKVLAIIKKFGSPSAREVQRYLGRPIKVTREALDLLTQERIVGKRISSGCREPKTTRYFLRQDS